MTKRMDEILARYFGGNASKNDMVALEHWLSSDCKNQKYFDELTILYRQVGCPDHQMPKTNTLQAKARFMAYMDRDEQASPMIISTNTSKPIYSKWMFQAACIIILFSISVSIWYFKFSVKDILLTSGNNKIEKVLPDGTQITLSKNSSITYRSNFGENDRILHLSGEATIHAGHAGEGRLQILTDHLVIEDVGTIFTISAYPDCKDIIVSVKEGQVNLISEKKKIYRLKANESCRYNKQYETFQSSGLEKIQQKNLSPQQVILPLDPIVQANDISLKKYDFQFDSKPLHSVVETISKEYGVNIEIESPAIGMHEITVHFDHEKLEIILDVVAETMNLKVKRIADGYMLCSK